MENPSYPNYEAIYNSGSPSLNAANAINQQALQNTACRNMQPPGGYTAISPQIANPPPPPFLQTPSSPPQTQTAENSLNLPAGETENSPLTDLNQPMPMTAESLQYLNGFIRTQIGRRVQVQFLIGTNTITDRTGTLVGVGANYILLNEVETDDLLACDFYNIKFIRFYY